jgi:phosphoenolpyruvate synthase/pyruvate phosphate dikinase
MFQHAMLTAREYGVPADFRTGKATEVLKEGQIVTVDGTRGIVRTPQAQGSGPTQQTTGEQASPPRGG